MISLTASYAGDTTKIPVWLRGMNWPRALKTRFFWDFNMIETLRFFGRFRHRPLFWCTTLLLLFSMGHFVEAAAVFVGAPGIGVEGNTQTFEPFGRGPFMQDPPSTRYQQVFEASEFIDFLAGGLTISELRFRSDGHIAQGFGGSVVAQINLSVTPRGADGLSINFGENIGLHEVVVFPQRGVVLGAIRPGDTENLRFPLLSPYFYDPNEGNLLMDIRVFQLSTDISTRLDALDASDDVLDTVSRVYSHDVNGLTGVADTIGLTTFFLATPVPEPSAVALLSGGLGIMAAAYGLKRITRKI